MMLLCDECSYPVKGSYHRNGAAVYLYKCPNCDKIHRRFLHSELRKNDRFDE